MKRFLKFLIESKDELKKVVWPTRKEAIEMTAAVVIIVIFVGIYLGGIDFILTEVLAFLLKN